MIDCKYKVTIKDIQNKYKFKIFCSGYKYDDTEIKERLDDAEEDIETLQGQVETAETNIETLQNQVEALEQQVEDLEDNQLTGQASGTNIHITDSANAKNRGIGLIANATQDGAPTPENPIPIKNTGDNVNLIYDANHNKGTSITQDGITYTVNNDGSISVNGTATANGTYYMIGGNGSQPLTLKPGNYVLSGGISGDAWIRMFDGTNYYDTDSSTIKSFILNDEINVWVGLRIKSGTTINATFYPKLEQGTQASPYSPYGCGNVNEKISNKNLFTEKNMTSQSWLNGSGVATYISTAVTTDYIKAPLSRECIFSNINTASTGYFAVNQYDANKNRIAGDEYTTTTNFNQTFTLRENCVYIRMSIYNYGKSSNNQLEVGTSKTDYVPHQEQNITFPLAQGQKLMEGDYLADDGVHHVRGETVLDGTEFWTTQWGTDGTAHIRMTNKIASNTERHASATKDIICTSNKYIATHYDGGGNSLWNLKDNDDYPYLITINDKASAGSTVGGTGYLMIKDNRFTTTADFKAYLAQQYANGTPVIVQYELSEEVIEPYTPEQKTAWEQIKKARTYKGVTHISSEDETPATVNIVYVKDLETVINELSSAIVAQGGV